MFEYNIGDELYDIQLRIKRSSVNAIRRKNEVKDIRITFEQQVRDFICSIYNSAIDINSVLCSDPSSVDTAKLSRPLSGVPITFVDKYHDFFVETINNLKDILYEDLPKGALSKKNFLLLLALHNYCWSSESALKLSQTIASLPSDLKTVASQVFLANPLIQNYFISSLKPVFDLITTNSDSNLLTNTLDCLKKYAPLIPNFIKKLISNHQSIFWFSLLSKFLNYYPLFGICLPDASLIYAEKINSLFTQLEDFFKSDKREQFIRSILEIPSVANVPTEGKLLDADPKYKSVTLLTPEIINIERPTFVPLTSVPLTTSSIFASMTNGLYAYVRKLLLHCELVHIDRNFLKPLHLFRYLCNLTSIAGNAEIEDLYEHIELILNKRDESLRSIFDGLKEILDTEDSYASENPLICVSQYSIQNSLLKRLTTESSKIPNYALDYITFSKCNDFIPQAIPQNSDFIDIFKKMQNITKLTKSSSAIFSIVLQRLGKIKVIEPTVEDKILQEFLKNNQNKLLSLHKQQFLEYFKKDFSKLDLFFDEITTALSCVLPLQKIYHIHEAYSVLNVIINEVESGQIGADQIVPLSIIAIIHLNPIGLISTRDFFVNFVQPLFTTSSPIGHAEEYSLTQFISTVQYIQEKFNEK